MAAAFVLLAAAARVGAVLVKAVVERPRPPDDLVRVIGTHDGFSFPSGHVFGTVMLWGFVAYVATTRIPQSDPAADATGHVSRRDCWNRGPARVRGRTLAQ